MTRHFHPATLIGLCFGPMLLAAGIVLFIAPHQLAFGGATGLSIIVQSVTGLPIFLSTLVLSVLVLLLGWLTFGVRFLLKTLFPTLMTPLWLWLMAPLAGFSGPPIAAAMCGAILAGLGVGVVMVVGGSTAGTDTIALVVQKKWRTIPVERTMKMVDTSIILLGLSMYGIETALMSVVVAVIMAETVKKVIRFASSPFFRYQYQ